MEVALAPTYSVVADLIRLSYVCRYRTVAEDDRERGLSELAASGERPNSKGRQKGISRPRWRR